MIDLEKRNDVLQMIKKISYYFEKTKNSLCEPYGLSAVQSTLLLDIYHNPNTKVTDICKRHAKSTNTISPLINRLVASGFVNKTVSKQDARVVTVSLTSKSEEIMTSLMKDVEKFTWPMFDSVSDEEFTKIYDALTLLAKLTYEDE